MKSKICKRCKKIFIPTHVRQSYCNSHIEFECPVCGKTIQTRCNADTPIVCSRSCASKYSQNKISICKICGSTFISTSSNSKFCNQVKIKQCSICGKDFKYRCNTQGIQKETCDDANCIKEHRKQISMLNHTDNKRKCILCGEEFIPVNNTQMMCTKPFHTFICKVCGKEFQLDREYLRRTNLNTDLRTTCSDECMKKAISINNAMKTEECKQKRIESCIEKYGVPYPIQNLEVKKKLWEAYQAKTGYAHPSHNPEVRRKSIAHARISKLEIRVRNLLDNYNIEYIQHYSLHDEKLAHEFDFYLPKYKLLLDADGVYYHSYLSDPDGQHVIDYYDDIRISLVPRDHMFYVLVEGTEDKQMKKLVEILSRIDRGIFDYDSYLFNWCRSIEFPYPCYKEKRLIGDWNSLCKYTNNKYISQSRLGESIIKHYHHSIFNCHVKNSVSPLEAWKDDDKLKKVIKNRFVYVNNVDPSKILRGFNVSKICPVVSMFNPVLAKYIINRYLSEFSTIFDPFSGFSGRMLGILASNKKYIGQDLNPNVIAESEQIIQFLEFEKDRASIKCKDIFESFGEYECLLTCPPYSDKEIYNNEVIFKSCDEWIDECLSRFKCKRYAFVVDDTEKYQDHIVEELHSTSHFAKVKEKVVIISK